MKKFYNILLTTLSITLLMNLLIIPQSFGLDKKSIKVGGAYLGLVNSVNQQYQTENDPKRRQFDFAANLDFEWMLKDNIRGIIQLQTGSGAGSIGFAGPEVVVTDLNLEIDLHPRFTLTLGSFDTPFCLETNYLTNNGDGFSNALLLNSLFYSAFAGTNVGTLNTLGIKGVHSSRFGKLTAAITNGTEEVAYNPDGNFEIVLSACTEALINGLHLAGSFIASDDTSSSGVSGTESKYRGWIFDSRYHLTDNFYIDGFFGQFEYGDSKPSTVDIVTVWKTEVHYGRGPWHVAGRVSC